MTVAAIETHGLHMHYGEGRTEVRALDGVVLTIEAGEMVAVTGPSGSGTLLHIVGALESPTSGTVAVGGLHYEGLDDQQLTELRRDHIGFGFQFFNLLADC
jgi:putative ABC transport system ATP-binding protein